MFKMNDWRCTEAKGDSYNLKQKNFKVFEEDG